ncbi:hypothetical protein AM493_08360 [Flavobacterium akiainvivens]|uniref:Lipocalin-like domain-containing protein n=1 Tax=Flavobacterium akiainvivens TaxID=1202724 RepID=A0A0M8MH06_9FLAO|nr:hypothetical protein [Flavobacterium akiainvivens]KOS06051.1 hypothetical protein AM493_08360 [Flavobacterium akiainvivens]SFQ54553.1 hypothetical protein SAMN05444144_107154 [Flavobacterium akiainvivens]
MKRNIFLLAGIALVSLASCSDDGSTPANNNAGNVADVVNTVSQGTWHITSYIDSGNNETNHFAGYNFTFGNSNVLTAANGTNTYTGTWSVTNSSNSNDDDSPGNDIDFNIGFSAPAAFVNFTDDWDIQERTANKISLIDVSGGNGGTDILVFEKN